MAVLLCMNRTFFVRYAFFRPTQHSIIREAWQERAKRRRVKGFGFAELGQE